VCACQQARVFRENCEPYRMDVQPFRAAAGTTPAGVWDQWRPLSPLHLGKDQAMNVPPPYRPRRHPDRLTWADTLTFWRARWNGILHHHGRGRGRHRET
jgi:hypothetical protein